MAKKAFSPPTPPPLPPTPTGAGPAKGAPALPPTPPTKKPASKPAKSPKKPSAGAPAAGGTTVIKSTKTTKITKSSSKPAKPSKKSSAPATSATSTSGSGTPATPASPSTAPAVPGTPAPPRKFNWKRTLLIVAAVILFALFALAMLAPKKPTSAGHKFNPLASGSNEVVNSHGFHCPEPTEHWDPKAIGGHHVVGGISVNSGVVYMSNCVSNTIMAPLINICSNANSFVDGVPMVPTPAPITTVVRPQVIMTNAPPTNSPVSYVTDPNYWSRQKAEVQYSPVFVQPQVIQNAPYVASAPYFYGYDTPVWSAGFRVGGGYYAGGGYPVNPHWAGYVGDRYGYFRGGHYSYGYGPGPGRGPTHGQHPAQPARNFNGGQHHR